MYKYDFTIFIPTYNRKNTLPRLIESIKKQTYKNFECIIIDDGSNDGTKDYIEEIKSELSFTLTYKRQKNSGKHVATNRAIKIAQGKYFVTINSDDIFDKKCLEKMKKHYENIPKDKRKQFAGVEGLCGHIDNKEIIGDKFPEDIMDTTYIDTEYVYGLKGDKIRFIKTDIFKNFLFPKIENEKFITESIIWNKIALEYKFRFVNEIFAYKDYLEDGLTDKSAVNRAKNSTGAMKYYEEFVLKIAHKYPVKNKYIYRNYANWIRFSLHSKVNINKKLKKAPNTYLFLLTFPIGILIYLKDLYELFKENEL